LRGLVWVGSSKRDYVEFPEEVQDEMGFALFLAQQGKEYASAKALKGFGGRGVLELVESHQGNAYRAVYTVRFERAIYVLHAFQKKSKRGVATPPMELDTIRRRLAEAEIIDRAAVGPRGTMR
jgi:phage-related protein